jgi:hypothetical protein
MAKPVPPPQRPAKAGAIIAILLGLFILIFGVLPLVMGGAGEGNLGLVVWGILGLAALIAGTLGYLHGRRRSLHPEVGSPEARHRQQHRDTGTHADEHPGIRLEPEERVDERRVD